MTSKQEILDNALHCIESDCQAIVSNDYLGDVIELLPDQHNYQVTGLDTTSDGLSAIFTQQADYLFLIEQV